MRLVRLNLQNHSHMVQYSKINLACNLDIANYPFRSTLHFLTTVICLTFITSIYLHSPLRNNILTIERTRSDIIRPEYRRSKANYLQLHNIKYHMLT